MKNMNKRTKFFIGVALIISAISTTLTFISLCFKKKSALAALAALATAEGIIGLSLIEDNNLICRKKAKEVDDSELFGDEDIDLAMSGIDAELTYKNDGEGAGTSHIRYEIPKDEEASEADFI